MAYRLRSDYHWGFGTLSQSNGPYGHVWPRYHFGSDSSLCRAGMLGSRNRYASTPWVGRSEIPPASRLSFQSSPLPGVEKASQIFFVHAGFTGRDIVQFAGFHPGLQLIYQAEQMIEGIDNE